MGGCGGGEEGLWHCEGWGRPGKEEETLLSGQENVAGTVTSKCGL